MEEIIYADNLHGTCPFCGNEQFYQDAYQVAPDDIEFISETCTQCWSTFPYRKVKVPVMAVDFSIPFLRGQ